MVASPGGKATLTCRIHPACFALWFSLRLPRAQAPHQ
jgi:hypothetical protein